MSQPTKGVQDVINKGGTFTHPANGQVFPRLQTFTVDQLLAGQRPLTPPTLLPYLTAQKLAAEAQPDPLF